MFYEITPETVSSFGSPLLQQTASIMEFSRFYDKQILGPRFVFHANMHAVSRFFIFSESVSLLL